jgi:phosphodiester glycosidase
VPHRLVASLLLLAALAFPALARAELPLGPSSLTERRTITTVAPGVRWTRIVRSGRGDGPWRLHVLEVDRARLAGRLGAVLAAEHVRGLERPSSMARRTRALAGVNGGYFAIGAPDLGDPVGVLAIGGRLVSEPVGGRTALLVPRLATRRVSIASLRFHGTVTLGAQSRAIDGVDRLRGRIPACGGVGGDRPTERPDPSVTCTDSSELIVYDRRFGTRTATTRAGVEVVLRDGAVTRVSRQPDTAIPADGMVLSGTGDAASFLAGMAPGDRPAVDLALRDGSWTVRAGDFESITGGGPRLLRAGRIDITARAEAQESLGGRNPRTLVGVRADGRVLLVVIDGRRRGWSAGTTFTESAKVMRSLGARDAMDFDDGGSSALVVGGRVVNRPSDPGGERAVSDGLFVLP